MQVVYLAGDPRKQKEGTALDGRKETNKNVNLVEKSCPRKTGLAEPWRTVGERLGGKQSCGQGRAKGVCPPSVVPPPSVFTTVPVPMLYALLTFFQGSGTEKETYKC